MLILLNDEQVISVAIKAYSVIAPPCMKSFSALLSVSLDVLQWGQPVGFWKDVQIVSEDLLLFPIDARRVRCISKRKVIEKDPVPFLEAPCSQ